MMEHMRKLKILYLEDSEQDAELTIRTLKKAGISFTLKLVDEKEEYENALKDFQPDLVLSDHSLYQFNSLEALRIFKTFDLKIPFILVTGTVSEEFAVTILKEGANDYLLKDNLTRLPNAILNAFEKSRIERERLQYLDNIIANEALLREAEHLAHFGSWEANLRTGAVKWSPETFRIYGYEPGTAQPSFDNFFKHVHPDDLEKVKKEVEDAIGYLDGHEYEFRIIDQQGGIKHISSKIVIERDEHTAPVRIVGFNHDITKQKVAEQKLVESFKEVAKLEKELAEQHLAQQKLITEVTIQAQEKERNELGKELHDNINQILSTVKMYLSLLMDVKKHDEGLIQRSYKLLEEAVEEIRKLSKTLVTPTLGDMGLAEALRELAEEVGAGRDLQVDLNFDTKEKKRDRNIDLMLYRIAQEQLSNVLKYSKASNVVITLKTEPDNIFLSIADNGVGFDPKKKAKGIGLKNILSRVEFYSGKLEIRSAPGKGCTIDITIPL